MNRGDPRPVIVCEQEPTQDWHAPITGNRIQLEQQATLVVRGTAES
jgi:hypothetical protein